MEHGSRTRLATAGILAVVFGAGVLLGFALDRTVVASPVQTEAAAEDDDREPRRRPLYSHVDPTEAQQVLIDSIVRVHRGRMRDVNEEFKPRFDELEDALDVQRRAVIEDTRAAIMEVLTPEQAEEYRRIAEEYDRRQAERREERDR